MTLLTALIISFATLANEEITGTVTSVVDGNTIEIITEDKEMYKILLHGIDCPELDQEFGVTARKLLEELVLEKKVQVLVQGKDRYGTRLGIIVVEGMEDPRFELLKEGLAWTSEKNPIPELEMMRERAREEGKGLWNSDKPTPPWIYRRQQSMMQPKSS